MFIISIVYSNFIGFIIASNILLPLKTHNTFNYFDDYTYSKSYVNDFIMNKDYNVAKLDTSIENT